MMNLRLAAIYDLCAAVSRRAADASLEVSAAAVAWSLKLGQLRLAGLLEAALSVAWKVS